MLQPNSVTSVTGLVQFGKNLSYILPPLAPDISLMIICSLHALKKSFNKKETRRNKKRKKEIAEVFQQASYRRKRAGN